MTGGRDGVGRGMAAAGGGGGEVVFTDLEEGGGEEQVEVRGGGKVPVGVVNGEGREVREGSGGRFTLGVEDGEELLEEMAFTLRHSQQQPPGLLHQVHTAGWSGSDSEASCSSKA